MIERTIEQERRSPLPTLKFPLTRFIVALYKKPLSERMQSDPAKAAAGYGLPIETTTWWINQAKLTDEQWPLKTRRRECA